MSQKIQVRRGLDATRSTTVLDQGEPAWATDTKQFYVGDGSTAGGIQIGALGGINFVTVQVGNNELQNGGNLLSAITTANAMTPGGNPITPQNPVEILVPPGIYNLSAGAVQFNSAGMGLRGLGNKESVIIKGGGTTGVVLMLVDDIRLQDITFIAEKTGNALSCLYMPASNPRNYQIHKCNFTFTGTTNSATYNSGNILFCNTNTVGGIFKDCNFYGDFGYRNSSAQYITGLIENCNFYSDNAFIAKSSSGPGDLMIKNCRFYGTGAIGFPNATARRPYIVGCYFSGYGNPTRGTLGGGGGTHGGYYRDCMFLGTYITGFVGVMDNCTLTSYSSSSVVMNTTASTTTTGALINCIIVGGNSVAACISGGANFFMIGCTSNTPATGINNPAGTGSSVVTPWLNAHYWDQGQF